MIAHWEKRAIETIDTFDPQNLTNSIWAYAALGIQPGQAFLVQWETRAAKTINTSNPQDLTNSLWAFATLGIQPSAKFLAAWEKRAIETIDSFNPQSLSNSLWALAVLNALGTKKPDIVETLFDHAKDKTLTKEQQSQHAAASLWFCQTGNAAMPEDTDTVSEHEKKLKEIFVKAALPVRPDANIKALNHRVDITVAPINSRAHTGKLILTEIDGPTHFLTTAEGPLVYNGSTYFQSALIGRLRPDDVILRLPFPIGNKLLNTDHQRRKTILKTLFSQASNASPGAYVVVETNNDENPLGIAPLTPPTAPPARRPEYAHGNAALPALR